MAFLVLYNPGAGNGSGERFAQMAARKLADRLGEAIIEPTRGPWSAGEQVDRAANQGVEAVVVCGGDGTVLEALQAAARRHITLGLLPLGTGNVLAQDIGLDLRPDRAIEQLRSSVVRTLPSGRLQTSGRELLFLASAGVGVHADLMRLRKSAGGGRTQYYMAGARRVVLPGEEPHRFRFEAIDVDGRRLEADASEILCTRVGSYGGVLSRWRPGGTLDQEVFAVTWAERHARLRVAVFVGLAVAGLPPWRSGGIYTRMVRDVVCRSQRAGAAVQADGTVVGETPVVIDSMPAAIRLMMPVRSL